ncbi:hypothetical protein [Thermogemmatispora sp.]|uniref:hypothetical protein n=1 Tax=Thermogemmatispora sp. TaxID=1968838 RepID=UPI0035E41851
MHTNAPPHTAPTRHDPRPTAAPQHEYPQSTAPVRGLLPQTQRRRPAAFPPQLTG